MATATIKKEALENYICEIIDEMRYQPWCSQTGILIGKHKKFEVQVIVTRDEDQIMGSDCNKRLISIKA